MLGAHAPLPLPLLREVCRVDVRRIRLRPRQARPGRTLRLRPSSSSPADRARHLQIQMVEASLVNPRSTLRLGQVSMEALQPPVGCPFLDRLQALAQEQALLNGLLPRVLRRNPKAIHLLKVLVLAHYRPSSSRRRSGHDSPIIRHLYN
jgi:hypothetical protein